MCSHIPIWVLASIGTSGSLLILALLLALFLKSLLVVLSAGEKAWHKIGFILRRAVSLFTRCKNDQRRRWQRLRLWLAPLHRHIPAATFYVLCVLGISLVTPFLFEILDTALRSWMKAPFSTVTASMLISAVAGFTTALAVSATRGHRVKFAEHVTDALAGEAATNYGVNADLIFFEPERPLHHSGTPGIYEFTHNGSKYAKEWMICLRQRRNSSQGSYTIESLLEQLAEFERWHAKACILLGEISRCPSPPALDWVCFITNRGRFCAFQRYEVFCHQLRDRRNSSYLTMLNQTDEKAMWDAVSKSMAQTQPQTTSGEAVIYPDAIPGLECFWIEQGTTREDGLRQLIENAKARAMLVRDQREGAPLGVISLATLADQVLFKPLGDEKLATLASPNCSGKTPPGLTT